MKIDGVNNNVINFYKKSAAKTESKVTASKKDTLELSSAGKSLSALSLEGKLSLDSKTINSKEKIEAIRNQVTQGTYKVDSTLTAKKIIDIMKGRDI